MQIVTSWMEQGIERGIEQGRQEGIEQGLERGLQQGKQQEAVSLALRLLSRRFGPLEPELENQIRALPLPQLEALAEALLDFSEPGDLAAWLEANHA